VLLGVPPEGVLLFELVFGVATLLEHGNFDLPRRAEPVVRRVFAPPALHRDSNTESSISPAASSQSYGACSSHRHSTADTTLPIGVSSTRTSVPCSRSGTGLRKPSPSAIPTAGSSSDFPTGLGSRRRG